MGRRHALAAVVIEQAGQEAWAPGARPDLVLGAIGIQQNLSSLPERLIDDRFVLAGIDLSPVRNLTHINPIVQQAVEHPAAEGHATGAPSTGADPVLTDPPVPTKNFVPIDLVDFFWALALASAT